MWFEAISDVGDHLCQDTAAENAFGENATAEMLLNELHAVEVSRLTIPPADRAEGLTGTSENIIIEVLESSLPAYTTHSHRTANKAKRILFIILIVLI